MFANTPTPWGGVNSQKYCEGIKKVPMHKHHSHQLSTNMGVG